jgi:signal transduction histidine kinase
MQNTNLELILFTITASIVILSTVTFVVFIIYKYQRSYRKHSIEIQGQRDEYEKLLLDVKLEIQEQTSHNIAREIHDSIGHSLTLAKLQLNTLRTPPEFLEGGKVHMAIDLLGHSIQQLSDISKNLNADALLQHGLLHAIEEEINRIRSLSRFEVHYEVTGFTAYLDPQKEVVIYRIIQEGFQNILKYAEAGRTLLLIHFHPSSIRITLTDDGRGFDPKNIGRSRTTGLANIENRIRFLNGHLEIHSEPGKGTRLQFTIPYEQDAQ